MSPHLMTLLIVVPLMAWAIWRRVRSQFGPQPIRRKRMIARIAIFAVVALAISLVAQRSAPLLEGLLGGLVVGVAIGLVGLRLTRFIIDPVKGDCYVPNTYVGALVTVLFLARMVWRYAMLLPQMQDPTAAPVHGPDIGQSPLTLAVLGVFVGYYICYFAGLLIHHQRIVRERPGTAV